MSTSAEIARPDAAPKQSLLAAMAKQYAMEPAAFAAVISRTVMPSGSTNEQLAAYLMVCREYKLHPLLRQVYAFPAKGGGIVPMVGIDGWLSVINGHPQFDGVDFEEHFDSDQNFAAVTCTIHRKDRGHPTRVTEFLAECARGTEPWRQMPRRMLRNKALIQCARIAFALGGIYDEDEARDIAAREAQPSVVLPPAKNGASKTARLKELMGVAEAAAPEEPKARLAAKTPVSQREPGEDAPEAMLEPPAGQHLEFGG